MGNEESRGYNPDERDDRPGRYDRPGRNDRDEGDDESRYSSSSAARRRRPYFEVLKDPDSSSLEIITALQELQARMKEGQIYGSNKNIELLRAADARNFTKLLESDKYNVQVKETVLQTIAISMAIDPKAISESKKVRDYLAIDARILRPLFAFFKQNPRSDLATLLISFAFSAPSVVRHMFADYGIVEHFASRYSKSGEARRILCLLGNGDSAINSTLLDPSLEIEKSVTSFLQNQPDDPYSLLLMANVFGEYGNNIPSNPRVLELAMSNVLKFVQLQEDHEHNGPSCMPLIINIGRQDLILDEELVFCPLESLAVPEKNKIYLSEKTQLLEALMRAIQLNCMSNIDKARVVGIIGQLSFHEGSASAFFRQEKNQMKFRTYSKKKPQTEFSSACSSLIFQLSNMEYERDSKIVQAPKPSPMAANPQNTSGFSARKPRVMISYNHKSPMLDLKDKLVATKLLDVWIDVDHMTGDMITTMATAVEECDLMLACVTYEYFKSQNCQLEVNYAHKQKKIILYLMFEKEFLSPRGWLGLLMSNNLYVDCTDTVDNKITLTTFGKISHQLHLQLQAFLGNSSVASPSASPSTGSFSNKPVQVGKSDSKPPSSPSSPAAMSSQNIAASVETLEEFLMRLNLNDDDVLEALKKDKVKSVKDLSILTEAELKDNMKFGLAGSKKIIKELKLMGISS